MVTQSTTNNRHLDALMQAAQAGDAQAYVQLLKEIVPRLRRIIRSQRRFLTTEDVEDIVQDVLLSLHAVRATYDPTRPFVPWLMGISRNRLADSARRSMRRERHEVPIERFPETFSDGGANTGNGEYREPDALKRAIAELPPGQRNAIELLKLREMSLREAAAASGVSVGALKVSAHRAIVALRKTLKRE